MEISSKLLEHEDRDLGSLLQGHYVFDKQRHLQKKKKKYTPRTSDSIYIVVDDV
jgi:hypothetical protein